MKKKIIDRVTTFITIICVLMFVWFFVSWFDTVNAKSDVMLTGQKPQLSSWNLFNFIIIANAESKKPESILARYEKIKGEANLVFEPYMNYTEEELYLLAHIINAEAGGATYVSDACVFGVGSVVLNRVKDSRFPNSIKEVLWQPGQYYNGWNGAITMEPSDRSWQIAAELLEEGPTLPPECVWQANNPQGSGLWLYTDGMYFCY